MKKVVKIQNVADQDHNRRDEIRRLSPRERMESLMAVRDEAIPYSPMKRVVTVKRFGADFDS